MKRVLSLVVLSFMALSAWGQQPQTTAPVFAVNSKYTQGVAPGYWPTAGTGLTLNLTAGTAFCTSVVTYAGGTLTMSASVTNYVYLNTASSCVPAVKTTAFTSSDIPIATVVAGGSAITTITDARTMFVQPTVIAAATAGVEFDIASGVVASPAGVYRNAPKTGAISSCYWTTLTSDGATSLIFNIKLAGTNIISGTSKTIAAGNTAGTVSTITLTSSPLTVTQGNQWELDITSGTSSWTGSIQCY